MTRDPALADLVDVLKMKLDGWCHAVSPKPMPERAQRTRGREFYSCCLPKDHEGPHRWPESGRIVEWDDR